MSRKLGAMLGVALLAIGVGLALAHYEGWLGADDLERQQAEARRALREKAEALEAKKRAFAEEQRTRQEREEREARAEKHRDRWPPDVPSSTLSCEEANGQLAEEGPVTIDPKVERAIDKRLSRGTYLRECSVASRTKVLVCAAILEGKAEGVTVRLTPPDEDGRACVDRIVRRMRFPPCDQLLVATTQFR